MPRLILNHDFEIFLAGECQYPHKGESWYRWRSFWATILCNHPELDATTYADPLFPRRTSRDVADLISRGYTEPRKPR